MRSLMRVAHRIDGSLGVPVGDNSLAYPHQQLPRAIPPCPPSPEKVRRRFIHRSRWEQTHMAAPKLPHFRHSPSTGCRKEWSEVYADISR